MRTARGEKPGRCSGVSGALLPSVVLRPPALVPLVLGALLIAGCDWLAGAGARTPHERYRASLEEAGLLGTDAGRAWTAAADSALARALPATIPHREVGYFDPAAPDAAAWRFSVRRGQRVAIRVEAQTPLFVDLYRTFANDAAPPEPIASADTTMTLDYEAPIDALLVLRIQARLLEGGRHRLTVTAGPSLSFPVAGRGAEAIQSFWGVDRDGGARRHEGVDIFAPRGTPVVAVADGVVSRTGTNGLGGNVVWLSDLARGLSYYYAHLDRHLVEPGATVRAGDTLGTVGNTGNARTTPPHLHFGLYRQGAADPLAYIDDRPRRAPRIAADTARVGAWARMRERVGRLDARTAVRVAGSFGGQHRVASAAGGVFEVPASSLAFEPLAPFVLDAPARLLARADDAAPALDSLPAGTAVAVLGEANGFRRVRVGTREGWIRGG